MARRQGEGPIVPFPLILAALAPTLVLLGSAGLAAEQSYAEKLGWQAKDRLVILHVDDAGMSHESNVGALRAIRDGAANSVSVMMPCPWVPEFVREWKKNPEIDAGLHLTLTSEWDVYRWGPLAGKPAVPGLVDAQGNLWGNVEQVVANATPEEVDLEIRAQLERARTMGFEPSHLDSHMGTLFASEPFLERYIRLGVEQQIPIMFPGGHNTALKTQYRDEAIERLKRAGEYREGMEVPLPDSVARSALVGAQIWQAGLPVLDDLHNTSYGWRPDKADATDEELRNLKFERYKEALQQLQPGVTMVIMHATDAGEHFEHVSGSGPTRRGDMLAMLDPRLTEVLKAEGLILTTFKELMQRRRKIGASKP